MPGPYGGPADQRIIQPHDHKSVHLVCFLPNGAPSWCKCCAHLVLFFFKIVHLAGAKSVLIWCFSFKMVLLAGDTKPFLNFDWAYEHKIQQHRSQLHATTQAECSNCSGSTCEDSDTECILHYSALFYTFCLLFYVFSSKFATIPCLFLAH